ncbi:MAG: DMT family transporter [Bacteroidales bacterium]
MISKKILVYIAICTAVILWGFSFIWTNSLLIKGFPVYSLVFLRMAIAALVLSIVSFAGKKIQKIKKKDFGWFLLLVLLEPFIYFIGETFGLKIINSPTLGAIIISTIPIFASVAGLLIYKEKITAINIFGITITLPGILLVVFQDGAINVSHYTGILLLFIAVFSAVGYSVVVKRLAETYNSYTIVTYQHILGALYFLPLFLINDYSSFRIGSLTSDIIQPILYLAILCSGLAFILFITSIKELGIARTNIFTALVPVVSAFGAYIFGHDSLNIRKVTGIIIVVAGVIVAQRQKKVKHL